MRNLQSASTHKLLLCITLRAICSRVRSDTFSWYPTHEQLVIFYKYKINHPSVVLTADVFQLLIKYSFLGSCGSRFRRASNHRSYRRDEMHMATANNYSTTKHNPPAFVRANKTLYICPFLPAAKAGFQWLPAEIYHYPISPIIAHQGCKNPAARAFTDSYCTYVLYIY